MKINYYHNRKYISNSDLGELRRLMRGEPSLDRKKYFGFGNLVDAMLSEPKLLTPHLLMFKDHKGEQTFTQEEWDKAEEIVHEARKDPWVQHALQGELQAESYVEEHEFEWQGIRETLPMRCKYDSLMSMDAMAADFKTTIAANMQGLKNSLERFDNDRQAALYMDLNNLNRFIFIGLGKTRSRSTKRYPIIHFVVKRGDDFYRQGLAKYTYLAYRYKHLIHNFNLPQ